MCPWLPGQAQGTSILSFIVAGLMTLPLAVHKDLLFSTSLPMFISWLFDESHSNRCEVIAHCNFYLHFPDRYWCWASFHVPVDPLYVFFLKNVYIELPLLRLDWFFYFCYWVVWVLYIFWILVTYQICICSFLILLPFHFLVVSFAVQSFLIWLSPTYLFLLLLLWESNSKSHCQDLCQRTYNLCFL